MRRQGQHRPLPAPGRRGRGRVALCRAHGGVRRPRGTTPTRRRPRSVLRRAGFEDRALLARALAGQARRAARVREHRLPRQPPRGAPRGAAGALRGGGRGSTGAAARAAGLEYIRPSTDATRLARRTDAAQFHRRRAGPDRTVGQCHRQLHLYRRRRHLHRPGRALLGHRRRRPTPTAASRLAAAAPRSMSTAPAGRARSSTARG